MTAIKIQRGSFDFGASEDTDTVTLGTAVASLSYAFAKITGVRFASGGPTAGTTGDRHNADLGVTCLLTGTSTVTFTRQSGGTNEDVRVYWEVIEFPSSGAEAAVVRYHGNVAMGALFADKQVDQAVSGITTLGDCVPFVCGISNAYASLLWSVASVTAKMVDDSGDKVRLNREGWGAASSVSVAVVEFTGTAWTVENNIEHNYSSAGANETETITDVSDITTAFVVSGHRHVGTDNEDIGYNCWFKDTDELYFRLNTGCASATGAYTVAHVVQNDDISVEHLDSILGGETDLPNGAGAPQVETRSVTSVVNMGATSLLATADSTGTSQDYPRPFWLYRLTDADEVTFWRGRTTSVSEWALQVIQWPLEVLEIDLALTEEVENPKVAALEWIVDLALTEEVEDPHTASVLYQVDLSLAEEVEDPKLALVLRTVGDVRASGNSHVLERHKEKVRTLAILNALLDEVQLVTNVADAIREVLRKAFQSGGPLLKVLGGIYNLRRRPDWTDTDWIRWMLIKRQALKSSGSIPNIVAVAKLLQPEGAAVPLLEPEFPKAYKIKLTDVPADERDLAAEMLELATAAGIRGTALFLTDGQPAFAFKAPGGTYGFGNGRFVDCRAIIGR